MSDRGSPPPGSSRSSNNLSRIHRGSHNDLGSSSHSHNRHPPSTRRSGDSSGSNGGSKKVGRSHSFKRTGVGRHGSNVSDTSGGGGASGNNNDAETSLRPRISSHGSNNNFSRQTSFVKNFLEEDDVITDRSMLSPSNNNNMGGNGSHSALQFDAETQRNVHRSLLSPSTPSPPSSPSQNTPKATPPKNRTMSFQRQGTNHSMSPPTSNLFQQRDDFYNVDQSVNLMDAEAGKYESSHKQNHPNHGASMVEIFLQEHTSPGQTSTASSWWTSHRRGTDWDRMTTWEKTKEICARLLVPLMCCATMCIIVLICVMLFYNNSGSDSNEDTTSAPAPAPTIPEAIPAPEANEEDAAAFPSDAILTTEMQAMSEALVEVGVVVGTAAFGNPASAAYQALEWVSQDAIALQSIPNAARRRRQLQADHPDTDRLVQRYVLAVLYYSWGGVQGDHSTDAMVESMGLLNSGGSAPSASGFAADELWLTEQSECNWKGVNCHNELKALSGFEDKQLSSPNAKIRSLNLTRHELEGTLPSEVTALKHLEELDLRHNKLSGNLDALDLSKWKQMEYLLLGSNQFTGAIPEGISHLELIVDIDCSSNQFSGKLPSLTDGGGVQLKRMENVYLDHNQLTGNIPASFLKGLPHVEYLDLSQNKLSGALPGGALAELTTLRYFHARHNNLTGTLPAAAFESLAHLDTLWLEENNLSGPLPEALLNGHVRTLQLSKNELSGPLPTAVSDRLDWLDLGHNAFTGTIPPTWFDANKALISVRLGRNQLTGSIPGEIGSVKSLEDLRLSENALTGTLPVKMGQLEELRKCYMADNKLEGTIPISWNNMVQLEGLILHGNPLTGSVPDGLCEIEKANEGKGDIGLQISVDCKTGDITCDCCHACH